MDLDLDATALASSAAAGPSTGINALPYSTRSHLRSTQILTSLPQVISELVQNSLDANARNVDVAVDPDEWECWVRDDGAGISRDGLAMLAGGSEARRYSTSKAHMPTSLGEQTTFGFRGEALASAADISCLEIASRTRHSRESWSLILKGTQTLYSGPSIRWRRDLPGTVVCVRDAFYNLPIRRRTHPNTSRTIELVKRDMESFALVFPGVSFSLENTHKAKEGIQTRSKARVLTVPKTSSTLAAFRHLYGRALAEQVEELDECRDSMRLQGFVSLQGAPSKSYQFLYINKHPLAMCELHRTIEGIFARSSFNKHAYDELGKMNTPTARRSPRKAEKKPVYVLNLTIPPRFVDNCIDPTKTAVQLQNSTAVTAFLSSVVEDVLVKHGFLSSRTDKQQGHASIASPRKRRKLVYGECNSPLAPPLFCGSSHPPDATSNAEDTWDRGPDTVFRPGSPPRLPEGSAVLGGGGGARSDIIWTDPSTGERFIIDARTGNSYPQNASTAPAAKDSPAFPIKRARMTLDTHTSSFTASSAPAWITEALRANEAYRLTERKIFALPGVSELMGRHACDSGHPHPHTKAHTDMSWDAPRIGRFASTSLRAARVLGQVDRKFIACVIRASDTLDAHGGAGEGEGALILIDQHAADERVRVERFLGELCGGFLASCSQSGSYDPAQAFSGEGVRARTLVPPVNVLLTRHEARTIAGSFEVRTAFARWGVTFAACPIIRPDSPVPSQTDEVAYSQVAVATVPEVVADKLLAGDELRDLIKGYLAKLDADGSDGLPRNVGPSQQTGWRHEWQRALRYCPRELVDLVNSKACRGAIMFNDTLTLEQCRNLLAKLSETALPFQCAHGRPSLVPLVDVGGQGGGPVGGPINWGGFAGRRT